MLELQTRGDRDPEVPEKPHAGWPVFGKYYISEGGKILVVSAGYSLYSSRTLITHYYGNDSCGKKSKEVNLFSIIEKIFLRLFCK
jgi:hypothetical protein